MPINYYHASEWGAMLERYDKYKADEHCRAEKLFC